MSKPDRKIIDKKQIEQVLYPLRAGLAMAGKSCGIGSKVLAIVLFVDKMPHLFYLDSNTPTIKPAEGSSRQFIESAIESPETEHEDLFILDKDFYFYARKVDVGLQFPAFILLKAEESGNAADKVKILASDFAEMIAERIDDFFISRIDDNPARHFIETGKYLDTALILTDRYEKIIEVNAKFENTTGLKSVEVRGKRFPDTVKFYNDITNERELDPVKQALKDNVEYTIPNKSIIYAPNDEKIHVSGSAIPVRGDDGEISGVILSLMNINSFIKEKQYLADKNRQREIAEELTETGYVEIDYRHNVIKFNPYAATVMVGSRVFSTMPLADFFTRIIDPDGNDGIPDFIGNIEKNKSEITSFSPDIRTLSNIKRRLTLKLKNYFDKKGNLVRQEGIVKIADKPADESVFSEITEAPAISTANLAQEMAELQEESTSDSAVIGRFLRKSAGLAGAVAAAYYERKNRNSGFVLKMTGYSPDADNPPVPKVLSAEMQPALFRHLSGSRKVIDFFPEKIEKKYFEEYRYFNNSNFTYITAVSPKLSPPGIESCALVYFFVSNVRYKHSAETENFASVFDQIIYRKGYFELLSQIQEESFELKQLAENLPYSYCIFNANAEVKTLRITSDFNLPEAVDDTAIDKETLNRFFVNSGTTTKVADMIRKINLSGDSSISDVISLKTGSGEHDLKIDFSKIADERYMMMFRNITDTVEQKQQEKIKRLNNIRLLAGIGDWTYDPGKDEITASYETAKHLGFLKLLTSGKKINADDFIAFMAHDEGAEIKKHISDISESENIDAIIEINSPKEPKRILVGGRWTESNSHKFVVQGFTRDVTSPINCAEEAEIIFRVAKESPLHFYILNEKNRFEFANKSALDAGNINLDEIIGIPADRYVRFGNPEIWPVILSMKTGDSYHVITKLKSDFGHDTDIALFADKVEYNGDIKTLIIMSKVSLSKLDNQVIDSGSKTAEYIFNSLPVPVIIIHKSTMSPEINAEAFNIFADDSDTKGFDNIKDFLIVNSIIDFNLREIVTDKGIADYLKSTAKQSFLFSAVQTEPDTGDDSSFIIVLSPVTGEICDLLDRNSKTSASEGAEGEILAIAKATAQYAKLISTGANQIINPTSNLILQHKTAGEIIEAGNMLERIMQCRIDISRVRNNDLKLQRTPVSAEKLSQLIQVATDRVFKSKKIDIIFHFDQNTKEYGVNINRQYLEKTSQLLLELFIRLSFPKKLFVRTVLTEDENLQMIFKDEGLGLKLIDLQNIFNPSRFSVLPDDSERMYPLGIFGTAAKMYIQNMGGDIAVDSEYGRGNTVILNLPAKRIEKDAVKNREKTKDINSQEEELGKLKILIVDDLYDNYILIKEFLDINFNSVFKHAGDGKAAVEYVRKHPDIDLILMDLDMPLMDGIDATRQIKSEFPIIPIIIQTAYTLTEDRRKSAASGADDFLAKPINPVELASKVSRLLRRKK